MRRFPAGVLGWVKPGGYPGLPPLAPSAWIRPFAELLGFASPNQCWEQVGKSGKSPPMQCPAAGAPLAPPPGPSFVSRGISWLVGAARAPAPTFGYRHPVDHPPRTIAKIPPGLISPILGSFLAFLPFHFIFFKGLVQLGCSTRHRRAASLDRNGERKGNNRRTGGFAVLRQL